MFFPAVHRNGRNPTWTHVYRSYRAISIHVWSGWKAIWCIWYHDHIHLGNGSGQGFLGSKNGLKNCEVFVGLPRSRKKLVPKTRDNWADNWGDVGEPPIIFRVLGAPSQVVGNEISAINSMTTDIMTFGGYVTCVGIVHAPFSLRHFSCIFVYICRSIYTYTV